MSSRSSGTYRLERIALEPEAASPCASELRGCGDNGTESASYEAVDVEIYSDGMWQSAAKTMWQSSEKTRTWGVFSGSPPACDDAAAASEPSVHDSREAAGGARGIATSDTVRVGVAPEPPHAARALAAQPLAPTAPPSAEAKPDGKARQMTQSLAVSAERPGHKALPTIRANNPTRIFEIPPSLAPLPAQSSTKADEPLRLPTSPPALAAAKEAQSGGGASRATIRTPSFSPVRSPVRSSKDLKRSAAAPSSEANGAAKGAVAPLLRAFENGQRRTAAWSEAQTLCQPLFQVPPVSPAAPAERATKATLDPVGRSDSRSWRLPSPKRLIENLHPSSTLRKRIVAVVLGAITIVGVSTLVTWSIAHVALDESSASPAPAESTASPAPAPSSPSSVEVASPAPAAVTSPDSAGLPPPSSKVVDDESLHDEPVRDRPSPTPPTGVPHQVTPARQAVDALLAGDRANALRHYRELSQAAPERRVYREAVRLLSRSASSTPN